MGFPCTPDTRIRSRNDAASVALLLKERHDGHFMVWNMAEERYDYGLFDHQVMECRFPGFPAPPLGLLFKIVGSIEHWLDADPANVAVVHCMTGRGRTSLVAACALAWLGEFEHAVGALDYVCERRGSTVALMCAPSQVRYAQYFSFVLEGVRLRGGATPLVLRRVLMNGIPDFSAPPPNEDDDDGDAEVEGTGASAGGAARSGAGSAESAGVDIVTSSTAGSATRDDDPLRLGCVPLPPRATAEVPSGRRVLGGCVCSPPSSPTHVSRVRPLRSVFGVLATRVLSVADRADAALVSAVNSATTAVEAAATEAATRTLAFVETSGVGAALQHAAATGAAAIHDVVAGDDGERSEAPTGSSDSGAGTAPVEVTAPAEQQAEPSSAAAAEAVPAPSTSETLLPTPPDADSALVQPTGAANPGVAAVVATPPLPRRDVPRVRVPGCRPYLQLFVGDALVYSSSWATAASRDGGADTPAPVADATATARAAPDLAPASAGSGADFAPDSAPDSAAPAASSDDASAAAAAASPASSAPRRRRGPSLDAADGARLRWYKPSDGCARFAVDARLPGSGDVLARMRHYGERGSRESIFRAQFNTGYGAAGGHVLRLARRQLDIACGDVRFSDDFFVEFVFAADAPAAAAASVAVTSGSPSRPLAIEEGAANDAAAGDVEGAVEPAAARDADGAPTPDETASGSPVQLPQRVDDEFDDAFWSRIAERGDRRAAALRRARTAATAAGVHAGGDTTPLAPLLSGRGPSTAEVLGTLRTGGGSVTTSTVAAAKRRASLLARAAAVDRRGLAPRGTDGDDAEAGDGSGGAAGDDVAVAFIDAGPFGVVMFQGDAGSQPQPPPRSAAAPAATAAPHAAPRSIGSAYSAAAAASIGSLLPSLHASSSSNDASAAAPAATTLDDATARRDAKDTTASLNAPGSHSPLAYPATDEATEDAVPDSDPYAGAGHDEHHVQPAPGGVVPEDLADLDALERELGCLTSASSDAGANSAATAAAMASEAPAPTLAPVGDAAAGGDDIDALERYLASV